MLKISYAGCFGLSPAVSMKFTFELCVAGQNREKITKNLSLKGSRSFKVIDVDKSKKPVTSACYGVQHVYLSATVFTVGEPIAAKLRLLGGYPYLTPSFEGNLLNQGHEILSQ